MAFQEVSVRCAPGALPACARIKPRAPVVHRNNNHHPTFTIATMTEPIEDNLDHMTPAVKELLERAFYGSTHTNSSSANLAQSLPLEKIALCTPGIALPSPSHEEVLKRLSQHVSNFQWQHGPELAKKIDRDCVIDALRTYSFQRDLKGQGGASSDTGNEKIHPQSQRPYKINQNDEDETEALRGAGSSQGKGSLIEGGAPLAQDKTPVLGASAGLVGAPSSVDPWAEGKAIYAAQREAARIAIPVLSKNYEDQKEFVQKAERFLQDARQAHLLTSTEGLTRRQVWDAIEARRERDDEAIRLFEEGTSLRKVGDQAARPLRVQLDRGDKWMEARGYDVEALREIKTPSARVTEAHSDVDRVSDEALKAKLSATGSDVRKKRKAGGKKHASQRAAEGEPGSAVLKTSDSATRQGNEDLEHVELKALPKEPEEQSKSGGNTRDDMETGEPESQAGSK
ncbi:hypothetical protein FRC00_005348 [Tulasnella sp. 408]|nr:hypothetical protein FRC00_005348 [Tulasnella sp. 408]